MSNWNPSSRSMNVTLAAAGACVLILFFQNCGKKPNTGDEDLSSTASLYAPIDSLEAMKLLTDGSQMIQNVRQAAFNGTYPNQNPGYKPGSAAVQVAFDNCVVVTSTQGSLLQSRSGRSCPYVLTISNSANASRVDFAVQDLALEPYFPIKRGSCTTTGTQSLVALSRSVSTVTLTCGFATQSGDLNLVGVTKSTSDLLGGSRLEDSANLTVGARSYKFTLFSDTLVSPPIELSFSIDEQSQSSMPGDSQYPTAAIWPLFSY